MTVFGVDYAFSNPSPVALFTAGKRFAMRYVGPGSAPKHLTATERDKIWAAGLDIVLLAEGNTADALQGHALGVAHARQARAAARALGAPDDRPIYYAVDFDVTEAQWPKVADYLRGCGAGDRPIMVGVYGSYNAMAWAARDNVATWFFQTYAWSHGTWYVGNDVEQYRNGVGMAGGVVDLCRAKMNSFGQWPRTGATPTPGGTDMLLTDRVSLPAAAFPELHGQKDASVGDVLGYSFARLVRLEGAMAALGARPPVDVDALAEKIAAALVASGTNGLTAADHAAIVADVKTVFAAAGTS